MLHSIGTQITVQGKDYIITGYGRTRYKIQSRAGKNYTYPMAANVPANPVQDPTWTVQNERALPTHAPGDEVVITGRGAGRREGSKGYVAKVNPATYLIVIPNVGSINASHGLVQAVASK